MTIDKLTEHATIQISHDLEWNVHRYKFDKALFAKLVIEECAKRAEEHARTYSDGDAAAGAHGAAAAIRAWKL